MEYQALVSRHIPITWAVWCLWAVVLDCTGNFSITFSTFLVSTLRGTVLCSCSFLTLRACTTGLSTLCAPVSGTKWAAEGSSVPIIDYKESCEFFRLPFRELLWLRYRLGMEWIDIHIHFFHNRFIEILFTYHSISQFKQCNSVVFSIAIELCSHHHNQF